MTPAIEEMLRRAGSGATAYADAEPFPHAVVRRGGFLNVHVDFARNPKLALVRRVNALVYLNEGWRDEWGGRLELCPAVGEGPMRTVSPEFNRMVVFSTPGAAHGHPDPVKAPEGRSRLCFSAYYFTSPDLPGSPRARHGVLFTSTGGAHGPLHQARRFVPPVVVDGVKVLRRRYRRSRV